MDITGAFPSNYLKADDLQGQEVDVQIAGCNMTELDGDHKPVINFVGKEKGMILNKTNATTISGLYGTDTDKWHGQWITLFAAQTTYGGKACMGLRVKLQAPNVGGAPQTATAPPAQTGSPDVPF